MSFGAEAAQRSTAPPLALVGIIFSAGCSSLWRRVAERSIIFSVQQGRGRRGVRYIVYCHGGDVAKRWGETGERCAIERVDLAAEEEHTCYNLGDVNWARDAK